MLRLPMEQTADGHIIHNPAPKTDVLSALIFCQEIADTYPHNVVPLVMRDVIATSPVVQDAIRNGDVSINYFEDYGEGGEFDLLVLKMDLTAFSAIVTATTTAIQQNATQHDRGSSRGGSFVKTTVD